MDLSLYQKQQAAKIAASFTSETPLDEVRKAEAQLDAEEDDLEKAGTRVKAVLGEKRVFGGREYIKTLQGWKFHGKGTGTKAQEHAAAHKKEGTAQPAAQKEESFSEEPIERLHERLGEIEDAIQRTHAAIASGLNREHYAKEVSKLNDIASSIKQEINKRKEVSISEKTEKLKEVMEKKTTPTPVVEKKQAFEAPSKPFSDYERNDIVSIGDKNYKVSSKGKDWQSKDKETTKWIQVDANGKSEYEYRSRIDNLEQELRQGYFYGPDGAKKKAQLKRELKKEQENYKTLTKDLSSKEIKEEFMSAEDPSFAAETSGSESVFQPKEGRQVKGSFRFNPENQTFSFKGKHEGGKEYNLENLSASDVKKINEGNLLKIDEDASSLRSFIDDNYKEFKKDNYQQKFFEEGSGRRMSDEQKEILQTLIGTSNGGVWKKLENADIENLTEEKIDSRFSSEREGYVGMYSGDLRTIIKVTGVIDGVKYQRITNKDYDTKGFW